MNPPVEANRNNELPNPIIKEKLILYEKIAEHSLKSSLQQMKQTIMCQMDIEPLTLLGKCNNMMLL
jgi:hypothetical protein